jgi:hypothetical protein
MKGPGFKYKLVRLFSTVSLTLVATAGAESPEAGSNQSRVPRSKPQVIYHLPPASPYAATLHSQAKRQNNELPIDSSMPTSLQTSRTNANAIQPSAPPLSLPESVVRPKRKPNRPPSGPHSFAKPPRHGNPDANKFHKQ